jgi:hypothetical protein
VRSQLVRYETQIEELEDELADKTERIRELEVRVDELDSRTDLLQFVKRSDELDGTQRSAALLQYLHQEAQDSDGTAAVTKEKAKMVLHHPDIDRTTYYSDFKRVRDWVGDDDICWYESKTGGNTRLMLDLTEGEIGGTARNKIQRK